MDHRVIDTLGSVFSVYLVWFGYSLIFVTHPSILHWTLLYLHPSYQSLTSFEPTDFIVLHDLIHFFCDQRRMQTSLGLFDRVFTCLWTLGSTSPMMVEPVILLVHLWWCTHIDSWDAVSWFAYISDLEFWLAFVHWGYVYIFYCIIIEHIPECFVWWDSMSYVSYYPTLGHTPILEFIRSFVYFLIV